ncbi:MAG: transposase [Firmicutes bacterium]|nr:transposase [Bacillota bacterium]
MLVLKNENFNQLSLMDQFFPDLFKLEGELARVDKILSDERFLEPFIEHFRTTCGRPTVPVDVYLRMMYLKKRYNLGYETLCKEVSDSISWRIFCHIRFEEKVPDFTTLAKLTKKYGEKTLEELNSLLIEKAREEKLIRSRKVRVDTTVVESNIHHPTDASLLSDGVRVITRVVKKVKEMGHAAKAKFSDRTRAIKRRILSMVKFGKARTQKAKEEVKGKVKEIVKITREVVGSAIKVSTMVKAEIGRAKDIQVAKVKRVVEKLDETISVVEKVILQTEKVLCGASSIPDRIVSIFDQKARPIKRGKAKADVEFGRKVVLVDSSHLPYPLLSNSIPRFAR